jgi:hypothetical protein
MLDEVIPQPQTPRQRRKRDLIETFLLYSGSLPERPVNLRWHLAESVLD